MLFWRDVPFKINQPTKGASQISCLSEGAAFQHHQQGCSFSFLLLGVLEAHQMYRKPAGVDVKPNMCLTMRGASDIHRSVQFFGRPPTQCPCRPNHPPPPWLSERFEWIIQLHFSIPGSLKSGGGGHFQGLGAVASCQLLVRVVRMSSV